MHTMDHANTYQLRLEMISNQLVKRGINTPEILSAFQEVPRHLFVLNQSDEAAYLDQPLPIKAGQTISQPYIVALMMTYMDIHPDHTILEIGSGSGYATALMSQLCRHIDSLEVYQELIDDSLKALDHLNITNVTIKHASGWEQNAEGTVYDRIVLWASPPRIPEHIFHSLKESGILVAPEGKSNQNVWICKKRNGELTRTRKDPVRFVPLVQGSVQEINRNM